MTGPGRAGEHPDEAPEPFGERTVEHPVTPGRGRARPAVPTPAEPVTGPATRPGADPAAEPSAEPSGERTVEHPVPPPGLAVDDDTADLLRGVLRRQAEALHPSARPSADGLARILAAARGASGDAPDGPPGPPPLAPSPRPPADGEAPGGGHGDLAPRSAATVPVPVRGVGGRPVPRDRRTELWFGRPHPHPLTLEIPIAPRPARAPRWLPLLAAAAAALLMVGGLGMTRLGLFKAPGLTNVVGDPAASAPAPHPPAVDPLPVYFVQRQHERWALVREFTPTTLTDPADRLTEALRLAVSGRGTDADHTSAWVAAGVRVGREDVEGDDTGGTVVVRLAPGLLGTRPAGDGAALADLAVAQLVWTATATVHDNAPVRIEGPTATSLLFGTIRLGRTFGRDASTSGDPRAPVWVSSLVDGQKVPPGRAVVQGDAVPTGRGSVVWLLSPLGGGPAVAGGTAPLRGENGGEPRPGERALWSITLPLTTKGRYVLQVSQSWPGAAPGADWVDTKTITVSSQAG